MYQALLLAAMKFQVEESFKFSGSFKSFFQDLLILQATLRDISRTRAAGRVAFHRQRDNEKVQRTLELKVDNSGKEAKGALKSGGAGAGGCGGVRGHNQLFVIETILDGILGHRINNGRTQNEREAGPARVSQV